MMHELRGAEIRMQRERALIWAGAMLPYQKKAPSFGEFVGVKTDRAAFVREFEERWNRVDASLRRQH